MIKSNEIFLFGSEKRKHRNLHWRLKAYKICSNILLPFWKRSTLHPYILWKIWQHFQTTSFQRYWSDCTHSLYLASWDQGELFFKWFRSVDHDSYRAHNILKNTWRFFLQYGETGSIVIKHQGLEVCHVYTYDDPQMTSDLFRDR